MNYRQSTNPVWNKTYIDALLNHLSGSDTTTLTLAPELRLMGTGGFTPTPTTPLASFADAEAAFSGYGAVTPTFTGPATFGVIGDGLVFDGTFIGHSTTTFDGDTVTGWWLESGSDWVVAANFGPGQSVGIAAEGDALQLDAVIPLPFRAGT